LAPETIDDYTAAFPWFAASVCDVRMLRIEELNDLMPAVQQASGK
jgi:virulence-associated protein VapD